MCYYSTLHKRIKPSIKDSFSKCDQIYMTLRIWSHFLKKSLMGKFIFCAVIVVAGNSFFSVIIL